MSSVCPCGSQICYQDCCQQYIEVITIPLTAEALMRSRYTAYTLGKIDYIKKTMKGKPLLKFDEYAAFDWAKKVHWLDLKILDVQSSEHIAQVLFVASYVLKSTIHYLKEKSYFEFIDGHWYYIDGQVFNIPSKPLPLNGLCYCDSGKKYKNCHLKP